MSQVEYLTEWMMEALADHSAAKVITRFGGHGLMIERHEGETVSIAPVAIDRLEKEHVKAVLDDVEATIICLVPRKSHYLWSARDYALAHNSTVLSMQELKAALNNLDPKPFRNKEIEFIQKCARTHSKVVSAPMICESTIAIERVSHLGNLRIAVEYHYEFGQEALVDAIERHPNMDAIVNSNPSGTSTQSAIAHAEALQIAIFNLKGLMGALNYAGAGFLNYKIRKGNL